MQVAEGVVHGDGEQEEGKGDHPWGDEDAGDDDGDDLYHAVEHKGKVVGNLGVDHVEVGSEAIEDAAEGHGVEPAERCA